METVFDVVKKIKKISDNYGGIEEACRAAGLNSKVSEGCSRFLRCVLTKDDVFEGNKQYVWARMENSFEDALSAEEFFMWVHLAVNSQAYEIAKAWYFRTVEANRDKDVLFYEEYNGKGLVDASDESVETAIPETRVTGSVRYCLEKILSLLRGV